MSISQARRSKEKKRDLFYKSLSLFLFLITINAIWILFFYEDDTLKIIYGILTPLLYCLYYYRIKKTRKRLKTKIKSHIKTKNLIAPSSSILLIRQSIVEIPLGRLQRRTWARWPLRAWTFCRPCRPWCSAPRAAWPCPRRAAAATRPPRPRCCSPRTSRRPPSSTSLMSG